MAFHVGQKVVCVDASSDPDCVWGETEAPREGQIYTVRRVFKNFRGNLSLWLDEICRDEAAIEEYGPNIGYGAWRFRPLTERKKETDISIFLKMLEPKKVLGTTDGCVNRAVLQYSCIEQGAGDA